MLLFLFSYILCGIFMGLLAGLLGIGGGIIAIPTLLFLFRAEGIPADLAIHMAVATSLAIVVCTISSSVYAHHLKKMINWDLVKRFAPGATLGSILGSSISANLDATYLQKLFGFFLILLAGQMLWKLDFNREASLPNKPVLFVFGALFGCLSGLLGLGGGVFIVPYFVWYGIPMRNAIASAAACVLPVAIAASIRYMFVPVDLVNIPSFNLGLIYLPAFIAVTITSMPCSHLGVYLGHKISTANLKKIFAGLLVGVGLMMLI